jgi:uncharacterized protein
MAGGQPCQRGPSKRACPSCGCATSHPARCSRVGPAAPEIYYGELTEEYVVVNTEEQELDYPAGDENVYTTYDGTGGVVLDSPLKRLAYSMRLGSSQILLSGSITPRAGSCGAVRFGTA